MSSPSTPSRRTTRSAASSPEILTPGRKIKAMLAAFDSDSDSDNAVSHPQRSSAGLVNALTSNSASNSNANPTRPFAVDWDPAEDDEDEQVVMPRGRMAARLMQGLARTKDTDTSAVDNLVETAFERVSKTLRAEKSVDGDGDDDDDDDDGDLPAAGPRRRIKSGKRASPAADEARSRSRSFSPLFMSSPTKQQSNENNDDDDEEEEDDEGAGSGNEDVQPKRNSRFLALVAQKRKQREEKEKIEAEKRAARAKEREKLSSDIIPDGESADERSEGRRLTQESRPARKASKKALEEMNRETQRMSRNMELTHKMETKKKITKESFFARFNFMQPAEQPEENSSTTADSQNSSDIEARKGKETPHTSPIMGPALKPTTDVADNSTQEAEVEFPSLDQMMNGQGLVDESILGIMEEQVVSTEVSLVKKVQMPLRSAPVRVRLSRQQVAQHQQDDSDSDLEIVTSPAKCRRIAAFENLPVRNVQEPPSMFKLKALAQLRSPTRKSTMNSAELSAHLLYQAKQQAAQERKERIEELRARGIVVETSAERAALEDEIENLVENARQEGEEIARREREASKRENGENVDHDDDDDDSDYDYFSGSEEEDGDVDGEGDEDEDDDDDDEEEGEDVDNEETAEAEEGRKGLIDSEADEGDESDGSQDEQMLEPLVEETIHPTQRRKRPTRVISDDEDEDAAPRTPAKPINPFLNSVERPVIPVHPSNDGMMSLTQAFAGTLAGSQDMTQEATGTIPQSLPDPVPMGTHEDSDAQTIIKDSQEQRRGSTDLFVGYSQPEHRISESPAPRMSQIPDPTQDAGFVLSPFDPNKRFLGTPPTSTIETVLIDQENSPIASRKLKNLRRGKTTDLSVIEEQEESGFEIDASAFDVMRKAVKKAKNTAEAFDRKTSKAKDVVEEAAEESDDEYAGLGGVSDDEGSDEEDAFDREMINDNSGEKVDAKQLAALNALHQRNADEKEVAKLLKDITTGALRRRRGAEDEFDLDDSDDELLARRREKQREFARMRNALLADGKIGEIAENPKKAAFFKAIEDHDDNDDVGLDFLGYDQAATAQDDSSSQDAGPGPEAEASAPGENKRKRPLEPAAEDDVNKRPPPHLRRKPASAMSKRPATLAEIRETVSFLTERPEYDSFQEDVSMVDGEGEEEYADDDDDGGNDEGEDGTEEPSVTSRHREGSAAPIHPRRTRGPVVDRLALLRQASSNSATSASANTRFAFHTGSGSDRAAAVGFRPPMLRRTTTTSSSSSSATSTADSSRGVSKAPGASLAKKGSVNYYTAAREAERERQLRTQHRNRGSNITALLNKHASNRLGALGGTGQWD
ncbi:hypothetical protein ARAM_004904 [Aspergillus rambellii]|uniref:DNA replication checkpoint mediator MRC1 domain-containing protein n=1 Tax=Aspergillus rambellii TaxID=308745 RepID=A0A0F8UF37_9EURO|nr:hypothetical protein ARAM_004904 [Aspergillus rambellii]